MTRLRIWLAQWILGRHGKVMPRDVVIEGNIFHYDDQTSVWTNSG